MEELKPCPFCGGEPSVRSGSYHDESCVTNWAEVVCINCGSRSEKVDEYVIREQCIDFAVEAWDRREDECDRDALIELADYLEFEKDTRWIAEDIRKALGVE